MQASGSPTPPQHGPRAHLVPINRGPWLDDRRDTTFCRNMALGGGLLALVSAVILPHPQALAGFWITTLLCGLIVAVFGVLGYGAGVLARHGRQTCPACLGTMARGATTCPHCHLHPPQEAR